MNEDEKAEYERRLRQMQEASPDTTFSHRHWIPETVEVKPDECLFCTNGFVAGRSDEHIFPRWLLREFNEGSTLLQPTWRSALTLGVTVKDARRHPFEALVNGRVCTDCNGGWMSRLEIEAKPLLCDLAAGHRDAAALTGPERLLLARWTVKTAAALNHASNFHTVVTYEQARSASPDAQLAPGINVFAHQMADDPSSRPLTWLQTLTGPMIVPSGAEIDDVNEQLRQGAWRIVISLGRLTLGAYFTPAPEWLYCVNPRLHLPVWPIDGRWLVQEDDAPTPSLPEDDRVNFDLYLFLAHESLADGYAEIVLEPHP